MSQPRFEVASGAVDGFNRLFTVSMDYQADSPRVWLNGLLHRKDGDDGWAELGGKNLLLDEAPRTGDTVQVYYSPIS